jgi:hypothetical protein
MNIFKLLLPSIFSTWLTPTLDALFGGGSGGDSTNPAYYDPYRNYRDSAAKLYSNYLTPGAAQNIYKMPGYTQFQTGVLDPSMDATKRSMAASGQFNSGNEQIALQDVGARGYSNFMNNYMGQLARASGADQNPANAANMANAQGNQQTSDIWSLIGGAASLYKIFSDKNMKENIKQVGSLKNGLKLYSFEYKSQFKDLAGHGKFIGVMAQEVEKVIPEAVTLESNGFKAVNYSLLGV